MPVVPTKDIVDRAFADGYGVAAITIANDASALPVEENQRQTTTQGRLVVFGGGIGVSAGSVDEDHDVAQAGVEAYVATPAASSA